MDLAPARLESEPDLAAADQLTFPRGCFSGRCTPMRPPAPADAELGSRASGPCREISAAGLCGLVGAVAEDADRGDREVFQVAGDRGVGGDDAALSGGVGDRGNGPGGEPNSVIVIVIADASTGG